MAKHKKRLDVTIAIPTFNGKDYIAEVISAIKKQVTDLSFEILVIDSGSTDNTVEIINDYPDIVLHTIPNNEFGHGKTRNLAAQLSDSEYIVFLTQDATPSNSNWLNSMVEPFALSDKVFCVFGKQIPRPNCDTNTKREITSVFNSLGPDHSLMLHRGYTIRRNDRIEQRLTFFTDVNSAVRLDYLKNIIPYADVPYSEDQLLGKDVLDAGYLKIYAPSGSVYHSNQYSLGNYFNRKVDEYGAMLRVMGVVPEGRILSLCKLLLLDTLRDYGFFFRDKEYNMHNRVVNFFQIPIRNIQRARASRLVYKNKDVVEKINKHSLEKKMRKLN